MDGIILVGGKGTRLRSVVADRPKPLAPINEEPFLDILLSYLAKTKMFSRVILASGHMGDQIERRYQSHSFPFEIIFSVEESPLGTGGAIQHCLPFISSDVLFVCNGDSYVSADLPKAFSFHMEHAGIGTLIARKVNQVARYGALVVSSDQRITGFTEKGGDGSGIINAGMYFFNKEPFEQLAFPEKFSLEEKGFPRMIEHGLFAFESNSSFIDIGTPESFAEAQHFFTEIVT